MYDSAPVARLTVTDEPCALSDLARRWRLPKPLLVYYCLTRDVRPSSVAGPVGLYDAVAQEELAKAIETKRRYRRKAKAV